MKTYYKVSVTSTAKNRGRNNEEYCVFNQQDLHFSTIEAVKCHLDNAYGKCKREKMYRDTKDEPVQAGWIYCFNNDDISHTPVQKWHQQDWVEVFELTAKTIIA